MPHANRLPANPIINRATPGYDPDRHGTSINGPSLIHAPDWLNATLGRYYLYFANHGGDHIRLAHADRVDGPYRLYEPGTLTLEQTPCSHHIASPEVVVDDASQRIWMYYHGPTDGLAAEDDPVPDRSGTVHQRTHLAVSSDGLHFEHVAGPLMRPYVRVWQWDGWWYALDMPGHIWRSPDGVHDWEPGPEIFGKPMRHCAVRVMGRTLEVYFSRKGDTPERIVMSRIALDGDWHDWQASEAEEVLEPRELWEGIDQPLQASRPGISHTPVRELRDPGLFQDPADGRWYLLYAAAGESAIAIAELHDSGA